MNKKLVTIREATEILNVSIDTLRRWDKSGLLKSIRYTPRGHRFYDSEDLKLFANDLFSAAKKWIISAEAKSPDSQFFCPDSAVFQSRLARLEKELKGTVGFETEFSLITSTAGEIGNNSFDHNVGSWPDIRGIFFGYDLKKGQIVLADRGRGVLETLKKARPNLKNDEEALTVAFTEKVSGRTPENRGNGLKYVRKVITSSDKKIYTSLSFQSGSAFVNLQNGDTILSITSLDNPFRGCLALISFK